MCTRDDMLYSAYADDRITQVLLGQLTKSGKEWTTSVFPAQLMREMVQGVSETKITSTSLSSPPFDYKVLIGCRRDGQDDNSARC